MSKLPALAFVALACATLAACGGDDGGGDGTSLPANGSITAANETAVARTVLYAGGAIGQLETGGDTATSSPEAMRGRPLAAVLQATMQATGRRTAAALRRQAADVTVTTEYCANGGTITSSFDDRDGNGVPSAGDVLTAVFAQCSDFDGQSESGTLTTSVATVPDDLHYTGTVAVSGFSITSGTSTATVTGSASFSEADSDTDFVTQVVVGPSGMTVGIASDAFDDTVTLASGMTIGVDAGLTQLSFTMDGTLSAASAGGSVAVTTPVALVNRYTDDGYSAGQLKMVGTEGSTLLLVASSATQFQLELDANGDGTFESITTVDQSTLLN